MTTLDHFCRFCRFCALPACKWPSYRTFAQSGHSGHSGDSATLRKVVIPALPGFPSSPKNRVVLSQGQPRNDHLWDHFWTAHDSVAAFYGRSRTTHNYGTESRPSLIILSLYRGARIPGIVKAGCRPEKRNRAREDTGSRARTRTPSPAGLRAQNRLPGYFPRVEY